jgi:site-specific recombinase XerD
MQPNTLIITEPHSHLQPANIIQWGEVWDTYWLRYFDPAAAYQAVIHHCETLPSSRSPEGYTRVIYTRGLDEFLDWSRDRMPSDALLADYLHHLYHERGLATSTIRSKYLAPLRIYTRALARQHVPVTGAERDFVYDCKERMLAALDVKPPRADHIDARAPLDQAGQWISRAQMEQVFRAIDASTKKGARDLAILYTMYTGAFRLAEMTRITLNAIRPSDEPGVYLVNVRGKRNNRTPVPIDHYAVALIQRYVELYNADLPADDPRRITDDGPLWMPILRGDKYPIIGKNGYDPTRRNHLKEPTGGLGQDGITCTVRQINAILGITGFGPHDLRRSIAAEMRRTGVSMVHIKQLLRHANEATTSKYVGELKTYSASLISRTAPFERIHELVS